MKPGDCINIPAEVKHWHGAAPDEWFSHLAIEVPGENGSNEWLEPVSEKNVENYNRKVNEMDSKDEKDGFMSVQEDEELPFE